MPSRSESPGLGRHDGRGGHATALIAAALAAACLDAAAASDPAAAGTARICLSHFPGHAPWALTVELADTETQRARGLMDRVSLPADAGMLFRYPQVQPPTTGFWMPRVPFPVDIAFLDAAGAVLAVRTMPPCTHPEQAPCPIYRAGVPFASALEVNGGALAAHGVRAGHSRAVPCTTDRPRAD